MLQQIHTHTVCLYSVLLTVLCLYSLYTDTAYNPPVVTPQYLTAYPWPGLLLYSCVSILYLDSLHSRSTVYIHCILLYSAVSDSSII